MNGKLEQSGSVVWSDYGSRKEKLDYFGKLQALGAVWHGQITEVERKNLITSVNCRHSGQYGMVGLRK